MSEYRDELTLDHASAIERWNRYHKIWKEKSILTLCSELQCRPIQVIKAIKKESKWQKPSIR